MSSIDDDDDDDGEGDGDGDDVHMTFAVGKKAQKRNLRLTFL